MLILSKAVNEIMEIETHFMAFHCNMLLSGLYLGINKIDFKKFTQCHHQSMLTAWIPLILSCNPSLLIITLGKSPRWHPVSAQS